MGDGRYYSPEQFFSILFLTFLVIFMTIRTVLTYYKGSGLKQNKSILVINVLLGLMVMLSIFERVYVSVQTAFEGRFIIALLFITFALMAISIFIKYDTRLLFDTLIYRLSLIGIWVFVIVSSIYKPSLVIKSYDFHKVVYGKGYLITLLAMFLIMTAYLIRIWLELRRVGRFVQQQNLFLITLFFFWFLPMTTYFYVGFMAGGHVIFVEYGVFFFLGIGLSILSELMTPYRVSSSIFTDVRKHMLDYVFIIDEKGQVIYKNSSVESSHFFNQESTINVKELQPLFKKEITFSGMYGKDMIQFEEGGGHHLSYTITELMNDQKLGGYILTFTEITDLINLLDTLKDKQSETEKVNRDLKAYKEIVYELEKEKEISALLSEIASTQQKSMEQLKIDIHKLMTDPIDFEEAITHLTEKAKSDLRNVREAVTTYRAYYGGEHD